MKTMSVVLAFCMMLALSAPVHASLHAKECQILDQTPEAVYEFDYEYIPDSDVDGLGSTDIMEVNADWAFYYYRGAYGTIDLNLDAKSTIFHNSLDGTLPSQVSKVALDIGGAIRGGKGMAVEMGADPGIYSDFEDLSGYSFSCPFSVALVRTFDSKLSGMAGLEIRPDFDLPVMPLIGIVWAMTDDLTLDARCPQSKLTYYMTRDWNTYFGLGWENTSYDYRNGPVDRLTMDYFRACLGVAHQMSNQALLRAEVGTVFDRTVKLDDSRSSYENDLDVDKQLFFRFGLGGAF